MLISACQRPHCFPNRVFFSELQSRWAQQWSGAGEILQAFLTQANILNICWFVLHRQINLRPSQHPYPAAQSGLFLIGGRLEERELMAGITLNSRFLFI